MATYEIRNREDYENTMNDITVTEEINIVYPNADIQIIGSIKADTNLGYSRYVFCKNGQPVMSLADFRKRCEQYLEYELAMTSKQEELK